MMQRVDYKDGIVEAKAGVPAQEDYKQVIAKAYEKRLEEFKAENIKEKGHDLYELLKFAFKPKGVEIKGENRRKVVKYEDLLGYNVAAILFARKNPLIPPMLVAWKSDGLDHSEPLAMEDAMKTMKSTAEWKDLDTGAITSNSTPTSAGAGAASSSARVENKTTNITPSKWGGLKASIQEFIQNNKHLIKNLLKEGGKVLLYTERPPCYQSCQKMLREVIGKDWQKIVYYSIPEAGKLESQKLLHTQFINALASELKLNQSPALSQERKTDTGESAEISDTAPGAGAGAGTETAATSQPKRGAVPAKAISTNVETKAGTGGAGAAASQSQTKHEHLEASAGKASPTAGPVLRIKVGNKTGIVSAEAVSASIGAGAKTKTDSPQPKNETGHKKRTR